MPFLALYWKHALAASLLAIAGWWLYAQGGKSARLECARANVETLLQQQQALRDAQQEADKANEALRKELARPKAAAKIPEIVRANPSGCVVPDPVIDGLREAIRSANKSAR